MQFKNIPANLRVPLFYAEVDPSHANTASPNLRALLIGSKLAGGDAVANQPVIVSDAADGKSRFGLGSVLAAMVGAYRQNDPFGELWALPLSDAGGATAATGKLSFTGPATAAGTLALYIAGQKVAVTVTGGMTAAQLATAVVAAISASNAADLPVTAVVDGDNAYEVNLTARNGGATGNDIDLRLNHRGRAGGEVTPAGIVVAITAMAGGGTNPTLTTALANLNDQPFEVIAMAYTDATSVTALANLLKDATGRWSWTVQLYGHGIIAYRGTFGDLTTWGLAQNDPHMSALGVHDVPNPVWEIAAAVAAQTAMSVRADPAQPIRNVTLAGILAPPVSTRFSLGQRNTLLFDGVSTFNVDQGGGVVLEKLITTYQKNGFGVADNSFLDAETLFTLAAVLRRLKTLVTSRYGRSKLAADGTFLPPGNGIVTPSIIRADMIADYREMEAIGWVQDAEGFAKALVIAKNSDNPNRVDVLWPGILINRLDVLAVLAQFRLTPA
ncbi:MAG: phage tail sheath subtilisin-like domain-containing protein [Phenylobacterium sp.]|nr:phage tail sheath subtilisin-like domain-containing protein [Phenylobacterium sp.]